MKEPFPVLEMALWAAYLVALIVPQIFYDVFNFAEKTFFFIFFVFCRAVVFFFIVIKGFC